ncbi:hypothetical protein C4N9_04970 [Pararhodobacter marinus]|uniref:Uncharacterized protein n=1 Tax=Pararhodobacter marinus TaxID=2184063 RepID=A0A2U2CDT2_9RHOB|nr:hypothetical protein [Pararhodobacter marinus]PWE30065.1 hypothetical protein C4N9_04970 [Pararhodobacter marinus]
MTHPRKISMLLAAAAALGAGAAGATTLVSGTNTVFVHQSPGGTVIRQGGPDARVSVLRSATPLRFEETRVIVELQEPGFAQVPRMSFLWYLLPWNWGAEPVARAPRAEIRPRVAPAESGVNRAEAMMGRVLSRMDR